MRRYLPSFTALQCFEASARHMSFTRAGEELHLTQSAVSRQVRKLEEFLQLDLFQRVKKRLVLSEAGEKYARETAILLNGMEAATIRLLTSANQGGSLEVGSLPTFGSRWLIPRLGGFSQAYPDIQLNLVTQPTPFDFTTQDVDVAIQHGDGNWPGAIAHKIMDEDVIVVCAPKLLEGVTDITPAMATDFTLLQMATRPNAWDEWLQALGVTRKIHVTGPMFEQFSMVIEAALAGLGMAILPSLLIEDELKSGRLTAPFGGKMKSGRGYYFVYPENSPVLSRVTIFRDWILGDIHSEME